MKSLPACSTFLVLIALPFGIGTAPVAAQEDQAVLAVVDQLFDGMRTKDSAKVRATFDPTARLVGVAGIQQGNPRVQVTAIDDFIRIVMGAPELDERVYEPEIRVDGNLAAVWTKYDLLVGGQFSHCGIDAFLLSKVGSTWKITQLGDTRQREGCMTPRAPT